MVVSGLVFTLGVSSFVYYNRQQERARDVIRLQDIKQLRIALETYNIDAARYPDITNDAVAATGEIIGENTTIDGILAPYFSKPLRDPVHDGVVFYYAYHPQYPSDNPHGSCNGNGKNYPLFVVRRFEHDDTVRQRDGCFDGDLEIGKSGYNAMLNYKRQ